ncbi:hypothetical protein [Croceicoccus sp. Ery15]|uniref:hypothetical protein n=1 Tax=Croceicoccus sp. Ery15 TaxID=1703338 RepID=UPI001E404894|nr:hypothetical protein [Croceicoccus sp. Ery15]
MPRISKTGFAVVPLAMLVALAACDDPPPGLETPERTEALERCDVKLAALANGEKQLKRLCDCTTGRLAQQGFTLSDLDGEHRDRAMEQVRWCMTQTGAAPLKTPGAIEAPDAGGETLEAADEAIEAEVEAKAAEPQTAPAK